MQRNIGIQSAIAEPTAGVGIDSAITMWLDATRTPRTRTAYADTIEEYRKELHRYGFDVDGPKDRLSIIISEWARRRLDRQGEVSQATQNQRLNILMSFYKFVRTHHLLNCENPVAPVGRFTNQINVLDLKPLELSFVKERLQAIDTSTLGGLRDLALLCLMFHVGRRASELAALCWGDLEHNGTQLTIVWRHCKGGVVVRDEVEGEVREVLLQYLTAAHGPNLAILSPETPIWLAHDRRTAAHSKGTSNTTGIRKDTINDIYERHLNTGRSNAARYTLVQRFPLNIPDLTPKALKADEDTFKSTTDFIANLRRGGTSK